MSTQSGRSPVTVGDHGGGGSDILLTEQRNTRHSVRSRSSPRGRRDGGLKPNMRGGFRHLVVLQRRPRRACVRGQRDLHPHEDDARWHAGARILNLIDQVRVRLAQPDMLPGEVAWMIDEEVKAVRRSQLIRPSYFETIEPSRSEASATAGVLR